MKKKVLLVNTKVKPLVDNKLNDQRTKIQRRLDSFDLRITLQLECIQASNIAGVMSEIAELQKLVNELHYRTVLPMIIIMDI